VLALLGCASAASAASADAASLADKARESGCSGKPVVLTGSTMYRCETSSGAMAYFNLPDANGAVVVAPASAPSSAPRKASPPPVSASPAPVGPTIGRIDPATQRSRDDVRRKVLGDELAAEEALLAEARAAYGNGAPPPLPEEQTNAQRYADRIGRLRQSVLLHERNVEALRKELATAR
jgi:hypothetical protein